MIQQVTKDKNLPVIKLTGLQLLKMGFNVGDIVSVSFSENQIIISKNKETAKLQDMQRKNPSIRKLIDDFELDLLIA